MNQSLKTTTIQNKNKMSTIENWLTSHANKNTKDNFIKLKTKTDEQRGTIARGSKKVNEVCKNLRGLGSKSNKTKIERPVFGCSNLY